MVHRRHAERRLAVYDVTEERGLIQDLSSKGMEIGVHGIDAWHDAEKGRQEQRRIYETAGAPVAGIRMHWLCFDKLSPRLLDQAGFQYDSTVGYNETVGYRAGTTQVFRPEGTDTLLELPMHIQDTALFYKGYLELRESGAWKLCETIMRNAAAYGGVVTILWHTRSLAPKGSGATSTDACSKAFAPAPSGLRRQPRSCQWFRYRRAVSLEKVEFLNNSLRITLRQESSVDRSSNQPNLMIRIHVPQSERRFVDIPGWENQS